MPEMTFVEVGRKLEAAGLFSKWGEEMGKEFGWPPGEGMSDEQKERAVEIGIEILLQER